MKKNIYILNFGDYFARLTARRVKKLGGKSKIVSFNTPYSEFKNPAGFILSGSPYGSIRIPVKILNKDLFSSGLPVMGICLGAHLMTRHFGGFYKRLRRRFENGIYDLYLDKRGKLFNGLKRVEKVVMMHEDSIVFPGDDFKIVAHTDLCPIAATWHKKYPWYNFQFHPEMSEIGETIFGNFVKLCYEEKTVFEFNKKEEVNVRPFKKENKEKSDEFVFKYYN
jgi:GMP synthase (glutamine-hydrolysing)